MIHIRRYTLVLLIVYTVLAPGATAIIALRLADRARAAAEESQRVSNCVLFGKLLDVYVETPPSTPAGQNVQQAYRDHYNVTLRCVPPR